jgi:hypothetical protein
MTSNKVYAINTRSGIGCLNSVISEVGPAYYKLPSDVELTLAEFELMKGILEKSKSRHNKKNVFGVNAKYFQIGPLTNYGVQYRVTLTKEGVKEIWINGFCKSSDGMYSREQADLRTCCCI